MKLYKNKRLVVLIIIYFLTIAFFALIINFMNDSFYHHSDISHHNFLKKNKKEILTQLKMDFITYHQFFNERKVFKDRFLVAGDYVLPIGEIRFRDLRINDNNFVIEIMLKLLSNNEDSWIKEITDVIILEIPVLEELYYTDNEGRNFSGNPYLK